MKKGKGYPEHVLSKSKTFGNPFQKDVWDFEVNVLF